MESIDVMELGEELDNVEVTVIYPEIVAAVARSTPRPKKTYAERYTLAVSRMPECVRVQYDPAVHTLIEDLVRIVTAETWLFGSAECVIRSADDLLACKQFINAWECADRNR